MYAKIMYNIRILVLYVKVEFDVLFDDDSSVDPRTKSTRNKFLKEIRLGKASTTI